MSTSRAVSVIVPTHNRAGLIEAAVLSALAQEGVDVEVLVCDDGSTDHTAAVVEGIGDDRVRWVPGARSGGPARPRNRGVAAAQHPWIGFLDSDDRWHSGKLAAQLDALEAAGADACTADAWRVVPGDPQSPSRLLGHVPARIGVAEQLVANRVVTSAMVVSSAALHQVGGFPETRARTIYEDYALWLRLAQLRPIIGLDQPWLDYRDDASTSVQSSMRLQLRCTANALRDFRSWRQAQEPPIRTPPGDLTTAARQLAGLVAVRDMVGRIHWPGHERKRPA